MNTVASLFNTISNSSACRAITPRPPNYIFVVRLHSTLSSMIKTSYYNKRNQPIRLFQKNFPTGFLDMISCKCSPYRDTPPITLAAGAPCTPPKHSS